MNQEIEDLQIRLTYQEEGLQQFSITVIKQQHAIDILQQELERLTQRVRELTPSDIDSPDNESLPPHY
jgi:SlyX protein